MKKNSKERLFEVMGRLDKTFKPTLNENFEELETTDDIEIPAETGEETSDVPEIEEKSPEEKLQEITAKVDEIYALVHGDTEEISSEEISSEEIDEPEINDNEVEIQENNLNEHHLDDRKSQENFICKNDKTCKKEDLKDLSDDEVKKKYNALEKKMGIVD
jgi:hypothetical protein